MSDKDDLILEAFKRVKINGKKCLNSETISFITGLNKREINKRLKQLEKFNIVRLRSKKKVNFWQLAE